MHIQKNDTIFLRFVAICLIVNSHLDNFYPVKAFATGGMIGNSIFFMLSSLGLYLSWQKNKYIFRTWFGRRIIRIYPPVWVITILIIFPSEIYLSSYKEVDLLAEIGKLFIPPFWFLQALLVYYIFIFIILKNYSQKRLFIFSIPLLLLYGINYIFYLDLTVFSIENLPFNLIFYFLVVLWGLYLGSIKEKINFTGIRDILLLVSCVACIYIHKCFMYQGFLFSFQFIEHLAIFPMLFYFLKIANSHFVVITVMQNAYWGKIIDFMSMITLETYIAHTALRNIFQQLKIGFPWNILLFIGSSLGVAFLINYLLQSIKRLLDK